MRRYRSIRWMIARVALSALILAGLHGGPRPGLYYVVGGICLGACRNDLAGRRVGLGGEPMGRVYQMGAWPEDDARVVRTGLFVEDGKVYGQLRGANFLLW